MFFRPTIDRWPNLTALANDIGTGLKTIQGWVRLDTIPGYWFRRVAVAAARRGYEGITEAFLAQQAEARELATPKQRRGPKSREEHAGL